MPRPRSPRWPRGCTRSWPPGRELPVNPEAWRMLTRRLARTGDLRGARAALRAAVAQAGGTAPPLQ